MKRLVEKLVKNFGERYPSLMGINIESGSEREIFKWFLASILFGAPIRTENAIKTYKCFERH